MVYIENITTSQQVYIPRQVINTGSSQNGGCIDLEDYYTREEVDALISGLTGVSQEYVDEQDAATLQSAEDYTDQEIAAETARTESTYAKPSDIPSLDGYATEEWVEEQDYLKEAELSDYAKTSAVTQEIASAITAETARTESTYAKSSAVTQEIATAIASETARTESTYLKAGALDDYYTKTEADSRFAAESAITAETTRATEAESGLSQAISAETSARESAITQVETALSGKADTATTLSGYGITDAYTKSEVDSALAGKADTATTYTKTEVDNAITAATSGKQDTLTPGTGIEITSGNVINCTIDTTLYVVVTTLPAEPAPGNENKIHLVPDPSGTTGNEYIEYLWKGDEWEELGTAYAEIDLTDYWTSAETQSAITSATSGLASTQYVDSAITAATSGLASTGYVDNAITEATSGLASESYVDSAVTAATSGLASETYVQNAVSGLASEAYVDSAITSATSGLATIQYVDSAITSATSGLASTQYVDSAITAATSGLASTGYVDSAVTAATSGLASETYVQNAVSGLASESYVESAITAATSGLASTGYVNSAITSATSGLQETLVSGTNIKTINNESLLGSGNITISGGSGGGETVIELTQAEYDALTSYTENTTYIITDATPINMDDYATTATTSAISADVATLSGSVANKADKASVTANTTRQFPRWNAQGVVTGITGSTVYEKNININGSNQSILRPTNSDISAIYAPTSAGTQNTILMSNGSGAPVWSSIKMQFISQSAYDALTTKDASTIYFIISEN